MILRISAFLPWNSSGSSGRTRVCAIIAAGLRAVAFADEWRSALYPADWIDRKTDNDGRYMGLAPFDTPPDSIYRIRLQSYSETAIRTVRRPFTVAPAE
ncbi:MAG TPA: hypothetical protein PLO37_15390 [Candidatus Hydrogenedentes bacterium]|nr:hypothetical protein [Candidatus Hydrogenedentota bacterium]HPG68232.1 hypothetical protein [Candidatus Hydrogenedentota bacterium]